jgi:integrase
MLNLIPPGQRKNNATYLARGSVANKVYEFNTYATDEKTARKVARELTESILREAKENRPAPEKMTFAHVAGSYVRFRNPSRTDCQRIDHVVREFGKMRIREIRAVDVHELAIRMLPNAKAATRNRNVIRPIVTVLHHAANSGLCEWVKVKAFPEPRPVTRALAPEAAAALVNGAPVGPQRLLLSWLFLQGTRISATLSLNWDQIDVTAKTVKFFNRKGDRWETFPIHDAVLAQLAPKLGEGRVFPWSNRSSLRRWLPALCKRVGVEFTPHMGRHALGTMMAANGETLRAIMDALGHSTPSSSLRYQGSNVEVARAAISRVSLPIG